jgi:hypothetical protein
MIFFLRYIIMTRQSCPNNNYYVGEGGECIYDPNGGTTINLGATARVADAANKSLSKENARLVRQVIGGLAGLTSAACVVTAYLGAEKARKEKSLLNQVLVGAAAVGTAAAAVEIGVQSYDLFMNKEQQPELGDQNVPYGKLYF